MASTSDDPLPEQSLHLEKLFPRLASGRYVIRSPRTAAYNCIAFAAGVVDARWWPLEPDAIPSHHWPSECPDTETLDAFRCVFERLGYAVCPTADAEPGFEKMAIFAIGATPTHAARQLPSGTWTSKLGRSYDIEHPLHALEGDEYGRVALILRRPSL
jgi:hypothetical protein